MATHDPRAELDALVVRYGESYAALSRMLGRNDAYLQQFVKRGSPRRLAERDRRMLADYFRVDEILLGAEPDRQPAFSGIAVPRIDAVASAGPGGLIDGDRRLASTLIDPALLDRLGVRHAQASIIEARGESMRPAIMDGDLLLVDLGDCRIGARSAIFVLRADGVLMVKRVARQGRHIVITSDNPDHPPVTAADIDIVGKVVWLSRTLDQG
jgi:hypothetical protein